MSSRRRRRRAASDAPQKAPQQAPLRKAPEPAGGGGFNPFRQKRIVVLAVLMVVLIPFEFMAINSLLEGPPGDRPDTVPAVVVPPGSLHDPYLTVPPTSGARAETAPQPGVYTTEIANLDQVAALAEGTVLVQYSCAPTATICAQMIEGLEEIVGQTSDYPVILAPNRAAATAHIHLTAWGALLRLNEVDTELVREFITAWAGAEVDSDG